MNVLQAVRPGEYHDSVFLMRVARDLGSLPGVHDAAAVMGTPANLANLQEAGFGGPGLANAGPDDLVLVVRAAEPAAAEAALTRVEGLLDAASGGGSHVAAPHTLDEALALQPDSNLALISVPGEHAAAEAREALRRGLHVFLFSNRVALEDEIALKREAAERGLLLMGPDCGTAMIHGVGIGFANVVRQGSIGVVGAAGTGIQELTSLIHRAGGGVSHAIGTGTRDVSDAVGGATTVAALRALDLDPSTTVLVVVSKPPQPRALRAIEAAAEATSKPVVLCTLGSDHEGRASARVVRARTLDEAASLALDFAGTPGRLVGEDLPATAPSLAGRPEAPASGLLRGYFAGGTLCYQAQLVLRDAGIPVRSNTPIPGAEPADGYADGDADASHSILDMGTDEFTTGRPHPMIDARYRSERILAAGSDPRVRVILLDVVLGYGAADDPAGDLADAIARARACAAGSGRSLSVIASVCGTDADPQGWAGQVATLEGAGATVAPTAAAAARLAARTLREVVS